jgi:protein TonB
MNAHLPLLQRAGRFASGPALPAVTERKGGELSAAPIRVGDEELTPLVRINPLYPPHLRRMKVEGYVRAKLHVDTKGDVTAVEVVASEPKGRFDNTVLQALRRWKFRPKSVDGVSIPYTGVVTIEFKLVK